MKAFETLRDELSRGYLHVEPVQLCKHAFALRTQAVKKGKAGVLVYLYAEPPQFPDGTEIYPELILRHRDEVSRFAREVDGSEVAFLAYTYKHMTQMWQESSNASLSQHADDVVSFYLLS